MKVIEEFIQSKTGDLSSCEDGIFASDNFIGVFDGATNVSKTKYEGKTPAQISKDLLLKALSELPENISAQEGVMRLDGAITKWYRDNNLFELMEKNPAERCFAVGAIFSKYYRQLWMVGECQAIVDGKHITNEKYIDKLFADVRAFYLETEIIDGKSIEELIENDTGREYVLPLIRRQTKFQNTENEMFGFDTFDGFYKNSHAVKIVDIPQNNEYIVLATDGYPELYPTLEESESALRKILEEDPLCFRTNRQVRAFKKGFESFDDRSYIRFSLS